MQRDKGHPVERLFEVRTPLKLAAKWLRSPFLFSSCVFVAVGPDVGMGRKPTEK